MKVLSLFDGMSCGHIALERADISVEKYYASEIDKYAIQVTQANYPDTIQLGSVIDLTDEQLAAMDIDILIGGSPCQGFSLAGKMKGSSTKCGRDVTSLEDYLTLKRMGFEFEGQSYLFWEFVRVWKIVKPKYFFLENVRVTKKWLPMFNEAMGVEPIMINSALVSAQNRVRFYWTNIPNVTQPEDRGILLRDVLEKGVFDNGKAPTLTTIQGGHRQPKALITVDEQGNKIPNTPSIGQAKRIYSPDGISPSLNTGWKPQVFENPTYRKLTPTECERLQTVPDNYTDGVSNSQRYKMLGNGWTVDVIAHIFKGLK